MLSSFSIARARFAGTSDPDIHSEIRSHTGSDEEAASILRSIARFGDDASIRYYEMTPAARRPSQHRARSTAWSVRAVR